MRNITLVLIVLLIVSIAGYMAGKDYENNRISKCIFGNEIGINYYHFAKIGKCLSK